MNLSNFTTTELWKLHYQIIGELFKRQWWQYVLGLLLLVIYVIVKGWMKKK